MRLMITIAIVVDVLACVMHLLKLHVFVPQALLIMEVRIFDVVLVLQAMTILLGVFMDRM